jgi:hypothetical protein
MQSLSPAPFCPAPTPEQAVQSRSVSTCISHQLLPPTRVMPVLSCRNLRVDTQLEAKRTRCRRATGKSASFVTVEPLLRLHRCKIDVGKNKPVRKRIVNPDRGGDTYCYAPPRTKPDVRLSRTRLPPRVFGVGLGFSINANRWSLHCATPDFLSRLVALASFMRLSLTESRTRGRW